MGLKHLCALVISASLATSATAAEHPARADATVTKIDGKSYKVIRYNDNTVKVVEGGMFGKSPGLSLRDAMRRAVNQATGCTITDDFFVDAKLMGTLACFPPK